MSKEIILKAVEPEDVDFMLECESDEMAARWSDYTAPLSRHQLLTYALTYEADPFAAGQLRLIAQANSNDVGILDFYNISSKDLKAYVGLCVHPTFRNKGLGKSILASAETFAARRLGLNHLVAKVSQKNSLAKFIFCNAGFTPIATLPLWHRVGNHFHDFILYHKILSPVN